MTDDPDTKRGLYKKWKVSRPGDLTGKHINCDKFVLDLKHDKFAQHALWEYIICCRLEYPQLAADLRELLKKNFHDS